jgi:hypothetical protein
LITKYIRYNNLVSIDRWRYVRLSVYVNTYIPVSQSLHTSWNSYIILHHHLPSALISLSIFFLWIYDLVKSLQKYRRLAWECSFIDTTTFEFCHMNQGCFAFSVVTISSWALGFRYIYIYITYKKKGKKDSYFAHNSFLLYYYPPKCYSRGDLFPIYENVSESSQVSRW